MPRFRPVDPPRARWRLLRTLRARIALAGAAFVATAVLAAGMVQTASIRRQVEQATVRGKADEVRRIAAQLGERVRERARALEALGADAAEKTVWRSDAFALGYLASRSMLDTLFGAAGLAAADGRMIAFVEDGRAMAPRGRVGHLSHVEHALASGRTVVSSGITDAVVGKPRIAIVVPLRDEGGQVRATLTGLVDLAGPHGLAALAESSAAGGDGETRVAVVDGDDRVIASDHGDWLMQPSTRTGPLARAIAAVGGAVRLRGTAGAARVGDDAFAWAPVPGTGWSVMTLTPSDALFASIRAAGNRALALAALGAGLAALGMLVVAALLLRPVSRLHARALRLSEADAAGVGHAAEDLDADWPAGDDEIGALGQAFRRVLRDRAHGDAERRKANASLQRQAMHDALTGLPNGPSSVSAWRSPLRTPVPTGRPSRCCSSTSTASRRSTTRSVTTPATRYFARPHRVWVPASGRPTWCAASAARSSP